MAPFETKRNIESQRLMNYSQPTIWDTTASEDDAKIEEDEIAHFRNRDDHYIQFPVERTIPRCNAGCIESQVHRYGSNDSNRRYIMKLQFNGANHPLLVAEQKMGSRVSALSSSEYVIRDVKNNAILGNLKKENSRGSTITYSLKSKHNTVAEVRYEVPSVLQVLKDAPLRRAAVRVASRGAVETKEPHSKGNGNKGLNFRGRGREPSKKNIQLQSRDGKVVLQFVKWDKDVFHLDFAKPFDAYHAFGFALAQFDI